MFLSVDVTAGSVLSPLKARPLPCGDRSVRLRLCFDVPGPSLLSFHPRGLTPGERAAPYALMNSPLLPVLASVYAWRRLRRHSDSERNHKDDR